MILVIGVLSVSAHYSPSEVRIGSRLHVLEDAGILSTSPSDTGVKEDMAFIMGHGLMTRMGVYNCKPDLILKIFSLKICIYVQTCLPDKQDLYDPVVLHLRTSMITCTH